ncbi:MAG: hypothetical protein LBI82_07080, partial [Dysgonamonadaceae bacterium]|nr:hypothetical protein [Dysgonamonadaceae bacterium]
FFNAKGDFLSRTSGDLWHSNLRFKQAFSFGLTDSFNIGANIKYHENFNGKDDGFSNVGITAEYRVGRDSVLTDLLFGVDLGGGSRKVEEFRKTHYIAGVRIGRQWNWVTLAGTLKTDWLFDDVYGRANIDFIPEAYFRITQEWSIGASADLRKSTAPSLDREFVNLKIARRYGRTVYEVRGGYEFEEKDFILGGNLNILF